MKVISVIVPVYKVEEYIQECLDSILSQSFIDFELILVDDGSPDRCGAICDEYAKRDNRIKVIHQKNGGLSAARNAGLDIAEGEYISFIDSDDIVSSNMLEHLFKSIVKHHADICLCSFLNFENISEIGYKLNVPISEENMSGLEACGNLSGPDFGTYVIACAKLYKKTLFEGIRFPVGRTHEDTATTYKLYYKAEKVVYLQEPLYFYRQNSNGIMKTRSVSEMCHDLLAYQEWIEFYQDQNEVKLADMAAGKLEWNKQVVNLQAKEIGKHNEIPKEYRMPILLILRRMYHNCDRELFLKYLKMGSPFLYRLYTSLSQLRLLRNKSDQK